MPCCHGLGHFPCRSKKDIALSKDSSPTEDLSIDIAKKYYYGTLVPQSGDKVSIIGSDPSLGNEKPNQKYLLWENAHIAKSPQGDSYIEIPMVYNQKVSPIIGLTGAARDADAEMKLFNATPARLLMYKDKRTGSFSQYIVNYVPTTAYLAAHDNDISQNWMSNIDKDFTGFVAFNAWDGTPLEIFEMKNGKALHKFKGHPSQSVQLATAQMKNSPNSNTVSHNAIAQKVTEPGPITNALVCSYYTNWVTQTTCYTTNPEGGSTGVQCTVTSTLVTYSFCFDDGSGNGPSPGPYNPYPDPCYTPTGYYACGPPPPPPPPPSTPPIPGCAGKGKINTQNTNATVSSQNQQLYNNLNSTNAQTKLTEYGFNQRLSNLDASNPSYLTTPIITGTVQQGNAASIQGTFTWNATDGYTIGFTHSHPNGSPPSAGDIFAMMANSQQPALTNAGASTVDFYKANASVTVVLDDGYIYVATVNDWSAFATLYSKYQSDKDAFNNSIKADANTAGSSTEAALLRAFGGSINLYTNNGTQSYSPIVLNSSSSSGVSLGQCP